MPSRRATAASSVVFSLKPLNHHAQDIAADPVNERFVRRRNGFDMIDIAFTLERRGGLYPATIGRKGQIKIPRIFVTNLQISFELHKETGEIMLVDHSPSQTCYVYHLQRDTAIRDFDGFGALVLSPAAKEIKIAFGRPTRYEFEVKWRTRDPIDLQAWKSLDDRTGQVQTLKSLPPLGRLESSQTGHSHHESRYLEQKDITVNQFTRTRVVKCVDLFTGHCVAVKTVVDLIHLRCREDGETRKEITTDLQHVEILCDYFHLVMELQDGDASHLAFLHEVNTPRCLFADDDDIGQPLLYQMLQALDYLASKDIIHRDVKPQNILYRRFDDYYHYRLADFGVSTVAPHPVVDDGTELFMAPEVKVIDLRVAHTTKIDVWSLAASLCWIFSVEINYTVNFRIDTGIHTIAHRWSNVIEEMLEEKPTWRSSAGDVLELMFDGEGQVARE
ncbi:hypothetical protein FGRMN_5021 [Fusarium graminum]|nr:hypothetical protein FGRMN_5021 [Fusarium graminum]